jgi:hypothetical protein
MKRPAHWVLGKRHWRNAIGGPNFSNKPIATLELFDLTTGTFTLTRSMTTALELHRATLLNDSRVLLTGGSDGASSLATAGLFR